VLAWNRCFWLASSPVYKEFSLTARLTLLATGDSWWITVVYGPQGDQAKIRFLEELRSIRQVCPDTWMICGDFNIIYKAEDKNNGRLHRRMMGRFRHLINDLALQDLSALKAVVSPGRVSGTRPHWKGWIASSSRMICLTSSLITAFPHSPLNVPTTHPCS